MAESSDERIKQEERRRGKEEEERIHLEFVPGILS